MSISTAAATTTTAAAAAVDSAVDALLKWKNKQTNLQNPQLLPQDEFFYLTLTLKKIPQKGAINGARTNPYKIPLPHPIISPDCSEICLIIDDGPGSKIDSKVAKKKIKSDGIGVSKVLKISKLRTDYKPHESKRKLCDSYDMFFADKRVIPVLPKLLGKQFFRKKKLPLGVDLGKRNWKEQIERGCGCGLLFFGSGTCCVIRVAKVSMGRDEIVENVKAGIEGVVGFVPKMLGGVRSLHLKLSDSVALPLYQALPDIRLKIEGVREKNEEVGKKKDIKKGRIHDEIGYEMEEDDAGEGEIENDDLMGSQMGADDDGGSDKKKRKGDGIDMGIKKRSKRGKIHGNKVLTEEKSSKKVKSDEVSNDSDVAAEKSVKEKKRKGNVVEKSEVNTKMSGKIGKKKVKNSDEVSSDSDVAAEKSVKEKKRKGNAVEKSDVNTKTSDKIGKKKGKKEHGDSGKKEKKKGRSVSKV